MKHLIGKQVLDLKLSPSADAFSLQQRMSRLYWSRVVPELESLFDQLSGEEEVVRIERLEIDLGQLTEESILQGKFIEELRRQLEARLRDILRGAGSIRAARLTAGRGLFEQWLFFLRQGRLPWSSLELPVGWEAEALAIVGESARAAASLRQLIRSQPVALQRLVVQHPASFLKSLVELFTGKSQEALLSAEGELQKLPAVYWRQTIEKGKAPAGARQVSLLFWKEMLETAIVLENKLGHRALIRRFLGGHFSIDTLNRIQGSEDKAAYPVLFNAIGAEGPYDSEGPREEFPPAETVPEGSREKPGAPEETTALPDEGDGVRERAVEEVEEPPVETSPPAREEATQPARELDEGGPADPTFPFENDIKEAYLKDRAQLGEEEIFLRNAGVVILHPFLTSLFRKLGYLEGGKFRNEAARHRAIHLVHYLAAGDPEPPEYRLVLPKVLCGLPLSIPLDHTLTVTEEEQEEGDALLEAVISHWTALKKTSPAGLREGFLQRDGKLRYDAGGWRLQVENKTLDILLNQLPWGIGVIKLPWMLDVLRVEWG